MRTRLIGFLLIAASSTGGAQIIRGRYSQSQPDAWATLGVGYEQGWTVDNGTQQWQVGEGAQYVGSLERTLNNSASFGVAGTTARLPVTITDAFGSLNAADVTVSQAFGTFHLVTSNNLNFRSGLDVRAGATFYTNFVNQTSGLSAGVTGNHTDFTFALGYGLGYSVSPRFSVDVVEDYTTIIHQAEGSTTGSTSARVFSTRLVARMGLGGR